MWRGGGILLGPGGSYRIFEQNLPTTRPLFVDQGIDSPGWFDVTDHGGDVRGGLSARLSRDGLRKQCEKLGLRYDETKVREAIERIIDHYR